MAQPTWELTHTVNRRLRPGVSSSSSSSSSPSSYRSSSGLLAERPFARSTGIPTASMMLPHLSSNSAFRVPSSSETISTGSRLPVS